MSNANPEVVLIVAGQPGNEAPRDREGGVTNSAISRLMGERSVNIDKIKDNLEQCLSKIGDVLGNIRKKAVEGWELEEVTISLAVSAEGSIGIATAGVETGIEVTFKPRK